MRWMGRLSCSNNDITSDVDGWLERLGLSARAGDRLDALSHGNQQRVQLIAALLNDPDLLVLDEPFSGPDPLAITHMSELLAELTARGAAVVFSSHQLDLVEHLCEDVVIIDHRHVVLAGDLEHLRVAIPQRFVDVRFRGTEPDWAAFRHLDLVESGHGRARLCVADDLDIAEVARFVGDAADVISFSYQPPTLSELFRQAVAA